MKNNWTNFLWLGLALILLTFSNGRWIVPVAAWLAPLFLLRFFRQQKMVGAFVWSFLAVAIASYIHWKGLTPIPEPGFTIFIIFLSIFTLLPYLVDKWIANRFSGLLSTLAFPLTWVVFDYFDAIVSPFGSWGSVAYTQAGALPLLQILSITGLTGVTFLIAWFAACANLVWENGFDLTKSKNTVLTFVLVISLVLFFGGLRLVAFPPQANTVLVAGINTPLFDKLYAKDLKAAQNGKPFNWFEQVKRAGPMNQDLLDRSVRAAKAGAKIIFWPELSAFIDKAEEKVLIAKGQKLAKAEKIYLGMPIGAFLHYDEKLLPKKKMLENKIVMIGPEGKIEFIYLKSKPVPGMEEAMSVKGNGKLPVLKTPYGNIAAAICYDMDFPTLARTARGADIVFVPAGDWKNIDPLHTKIASFRAIENGYSLVRVVRYGLTAAFDYQGRELASMDDFTANDKLMLAQVPVKGTATLYSAIGNIFAGLCLAGLLTLVIFGLIKK